MSRLKLSIVHYLNSLPLSWGFLRGRQHEVFDLDLSAPSRCADLLAGGMVDIGLIPSIEYQRIEGLRIIPDLSVASKNRVKSVLLLSKVPVESINTLALDNSSRTSICMLKILLKQRFKAKPTLSSQAPNLEAMLLNSDAALIIGDAALQASQHGLFLYDLAQEWRSETGKPFVFAFWAVRNSGQLEDRSVFQKSYQFGMDHLKEIAEENSQRLAIPEKEVLAYLTSNIDYTLDQENLEGLNLFYELAREHRLLDCLRPLEFV